MENKIQTENWAEEPPPFWKSWSVWYAIVIGTLGVLILFFYLFTISYQ